MRDWYFPKEYFAEGRLAGGNGADDDGELRRRDAEIDILQAELVGLPAKAALLNPESRCGR